MSTYYAPRAVTGLGGDNPLLSSSLRAHTRELSSLSAAGKSTRQISSGKIKLRPVLSGETPNPPFARANRAVSLRLFLSRGVEGRRSKAHFF